MAKLLRATESYWAGNRFVQAGTILHPGDSRAVGLYVEEFDTPDEPEVAEKPKRGRPPKNQQT